MKPAVLIFSLALVITSCKNENKQASDTVHDHGKEQVVTEKKKVLSPHTETMAMIGDAHIHIDYSSPGVRNRIIFGGLLAYDEVWQAGAHMATWIETNKDLIIDGKTLKAGKYGFFTIPSKENWTLIFNTRWDQHGKDDYKQEEDVLRLNVVPETPDEMTEHLIYEVKETESNNGIISFAWENVKVVLPFQVKQ